MAVGTGRGSNMGTTPGTGVTGRAPSANPVDNRTGLPIGQDYTAPKSTIINGKTYIPMQGKPAGTNDDIIGDDKNGYWRALPSPGGGGYDDGGGAGPRRGPGPAGPPVQPPSIEEVKQQLPPPIPRDPMPARIPHPDPVDRRAADAASFARAKDQAGDAAGGAIRALQRQAQTRGFSGTGMEAGGVSSLLAHASGSLGDISREQAINDVAANQHDTDRNYAADLGQRSGDMGFVTNQRGQDIDQQNARISQIPSLWALLHRSRGGAAY